MNTLNVNMTLDPATGGGSPERTLQISSSLNRDGHQCLILTTDAGLSPAFLQLCRKWGLSVVVGPSIWKRFYLPQPSQHLIKKFVAGVGVVNLMSHWTLINALVYHVLVSDGNNVYCRCVGRRQ